MAHGRAQVGPRRHCVDEVRETEAARVLYLPQCSEEFDAFRDELQLCGTGSHALQEARQLDFAVDVGPCKHHTHGAG
jgi:hypothetical protein